MTNSREFLPNHLQEAIQILDDVDHRSSQANSGPVSNHMNRKRLKKAKRLARRAAGR